MPRGRLLSAVVTLAVVAGVVVGAAVAAPGSATATVLPDPSGSPWRGFFEFDQTGSHAWSTAKESVDCTWTKHVRVQTAGTQTYYESYWDGELDTRNWEGPYTYVVTGEGSCSEQLWDPEPNGPCHRSWTWGHYEASTTPVYSGSTGGLHLLVGGGDDPDSGSEVTEPYFVAGVRWAWDSPDVRQYSQDTCSESVTWTYGFSQTDPPVGIGLCWLSWPYDFDEPVPAGARVHGSWTSTQGEWPRYHPHGNIDCLTDAEHQDTSWVNSWTWDFEYGFAPDPDEPDPDEPPPGDCERLASGLDPCLLEPGDILLWRSQDANPVQVLYADTFWTHSAMYLGRMNLDGEPGFEFAIADALPEAHTPRMVAIRDITTTSFGQALGEIAAVSVHRLNLPAGVRLAAAERLRDHLLFEGDAAANIVPVGHSYDWWAKEFGYGQIGPLPDPTATGPQQFYCSSMVAWAYAEVGYEIVGASDWYRPIDLVYTTPDDLIDNQYGSSWVDGSQVVGETFGMHSPANILLTDHLGRRTGVAPDGTLHDEIPGAWWVDAPHVEAISTPPTQADWTLTISGYDHGAYTLVHRVTDGTGSPPVVLDGVAEPGAVVTLTLGELAAKAAERVPARVAGPDRFATAVAVAQRMDPSDTVVVATGLDFPDALSAGPLAAATASPLLLTHRSHLPEVVEAELDRRAPATIYLVGGGAAISPEVEQHLEARYPAATVTRVFGPDRYATSRALADVVRSLPGTADGAYLVSGENFPDAVAVSALAAATRTPIVLTPRATTHAETTAALLAAGGTATIVGGEAAVAEAVADGYRAAGATIAAGRLAGPDRYATSAAVAAAFPFAISAGGIAHRHVWMATGGNFPDALAAGPGAAQRHATLLLTPTDALAPATHTYLASLCLDGLASVSLTGGEAALSPHVHDQAAGYLAGTCAT